MAPNRIDGVVIVMRRLLATGHWRGGIRRYPATQLFHDFDTNRLAVTQTLGTHRVGNFPCPSLTLCLSGLLSQAKIALKGTSEDQLLELEAIAKSLNLCARLIRDP